MTRYLIKRLALIPLLLWGIVTIAFVLSRSVSSNPLATIVGERNLGNPEIVAAATKRWGLDKSLLEQYVLYIGNLMHGDMGTSFRTKAPVLSDISQRLPATLELAFCALIIAVLIGTGLGVVAARTRGRVTDTGIRVFALAGSSLPVFWIGLVFLFVFYASLGISPGPGRLSPRVRAPEQVTGFYTVDALLEGNVPLFIDALQHLIMPAFIMSLALLGTLIRLVRAQMIEQQSSDYVRTARAKGMTVTQVMSRHVLKNAITPVITIVGVSVGIIIMGAVLIETIFSWNGIGTYAVDASRTLDFPAISGVCLVGGIIFLVSNLVADVAYAVVDPRVRLA